MKRFLYLWQIVLFELPYLGEILAGICLTLLPIPNGAKGFLPECHVMVVLYLPGEGVLWWILSLNLGALLAKGADPNLLLI